MKKGIVARLVVTAGIAIALLVSYLIQSYHIDLVAALPKPLIERALLQAELTGKIVEWYAFAVVFVVVVRGGGWRR